MNAVIDSLAALTLLRPWWLLALLPLAWFGWRAWRGAARAAGRHDATASSAAAAGAAGADDAPAAGVWEAVVDRPLRAAVLVFAPGPVGGMVAPFVALLLALLLVVLALAGPALRSDAPLPDVAYRGDALRVLVVDASPVMNAGASPPAGVGAPQSGTAVRPSAGVTPAAERARGALLDLLAALPAGHTALIAYAEEPYLIAPPTSDVATIALLVPELGPAVMPLAGDRPERALRMAAELLARSTAGTRDLVWLSNRADLPPAAAAALATLAGVRVSVLHFAAADSEALRGATLHSGGRYRRLADDGDAPRALAAALAEGSAWVAEARRGAAGRVVDLGPWLVLLALPFAAFAMRGVLVSAARRERHLERRSEARPGAVRAASLPGVVVMLAAAALAAPPPAQAVETTEADRAAHRRLLAGDAAAAAALFADPRWRAVAAYRAGDFVGAAAALARIDEPDAHYNRGNALARAGDLRGALAAYETALALRPDDADALHNRDLVRELLAPPPGDPPPPNEKPDRRPNQTPQPSSQSAPQDPPPAKQPSPAGSPPPPAPSASNHRREAESLASQWLRRPPDDPAGLLQRKLLLEHQRRQAGTESQPWR